MDGEIVHAKGLLGGGFRPDATGGARGGGVAIASPNPLPEREGRV